MQTNNNQVYNSVCIFTVCHHFSLFDTPCKAVFNNIIFTLSVFVYSQKDNVMRIKKDYFLL